MQTQAFTDQLPCRTVQLQGGEHLYFSGTSYLGMACNKAFHELVEQGIRRYGTNYASTRRSNLQLEVYEQVEQQLAQQARAEAALTMSSGFLMGQTLVQVLRNQGKFIYAPCAHPALWLDDSVAAQAGATIPFTTWAEQVVQEITASEEEAFVVLCNALDPLLAEAYSFDWVRQLPQQKKITLVVDDSHGFGVRGPEGAGIYPELKQFTNVELVVVSSFGKALGIPAGFILGSRELVAQVQASPFFGGASPAIPAYLHAYQQAGALIEESRQLLQQNISTFLEHLERAQELFRFIPGYPVFSAKVEGLDQYLLQHRVLVSSFRYPTATSAPMTRIVLSSLHTPEDLRQLTAAINQFKPEIVM